MTLYDLLNTLPVYQYIDLFVTNMDDTEITDHFYGNNAALAYPKSDHYLKSVNVLKLYAEERYGHSNIVVNAKETQYTPAE